MKNLKVLAIILLTCSLLTNNAHAQSDIPSTGMLYNTQEVSLLTYNCHMLNTGKLECEFIQTSVRKKLKSEDIEQKITEAKKQFPDALKEISSDDVCKKDIPYIEALTGQKTPEEVAETASKDFISNKEEFIQSVKEMSQAQKSEIVGVFNAIKIFCKERTEKSYLDIAKLGFEKDSRTCTISAGYSFKQTFTYVEDYSSGTGAWVVESKPEGPCGTVQLSRFVAEKMKIKNSEYINWKYLAKKAITNKDGTFFGNFKCNQADENEHLYDWKTSPKTDRLYQLGCEFIEFSPL